MQTSLPCPWDTLLLICAPRGWERTPWGGQLTACPTVSYDVPGSSPSPITACPTVSYGRRSPLRAFRRGGGGSTYVDPRKARSGPASAHPAGSPQRPRQGWGLGPHMCPKKGTHPPLPPGGELDQTNQTR